MSDLEIEKKIKFPDKHYVGFQRRKESVNLGFMTPYGEDSAAKKRMQTVDNWSKGSLREYDWRTKTYIEHDRIPAIIYDNIAQNGFKLSNSVNHSSSWNSCRDKWRIEDPRGFELEITSGNLEKIIELCDIVKGTIQGDLIWARLGAENILVPVESEIYKNALNNTNRYGTKISIKDVRVGDNVTLQDGSVVRYIGHMYYILNEDNTCYTNFEIYKIKRHIFEKEKSFIAIADPKISSIETGYVKIDDPVKYVNNKIKSGYTIYSNNHVYIIGVTNCTSYTVEINKTKDLNYDQAKTLGHKHGFMLHKGNLSEFYINYYYNNVTPKFLEGYNINLVIDENTLSVKQHDRRRYGYATRIVYPSSFDVYTITVKTDDAEIKVLI